MLCPGEYIHKLGTGVALRTMWWARHALQHAVRQIPSLVPAIAKRLPAPTQVPQVPTAISPWLRRLLPLNGLLLVVEILNLPYGKLSM